MAKELGRISKPAAKQFTRKRKLYLVPLLFSWNSAPEGYVTKLDTYWQQVEEHIANLEAKAGKVGRVYHESITAAGEEGLKVLEKLSPASYHIVRSKCQDGAQLEATEDKELAEESMDWERHLLMGFMSVRIAKVVSEFFAEASRKRYEYIAHRIDETLKGNEAAVLFIWEGHRVQFPRDIEVFMVAPPMLDEIRRWLRDQPADEPEESQK